MKPDENEFSTDSMTLAEWLRSGWDGNDGNDDETNNNEGKR
jgi:hypothetical protein